MKKIENVIGRTELREIRKESEENGEKQLLIENVVRENCKEKRQRKDDSNHGTTREQQLMCYLMRRTHQAPSLYNTRPFDRTFPR